MTSERRFSDAQLNSLLDNELDADQRASLLSAIQVDSELAARYAKLCQIKEMFNRAYSEPKQGYNRAQTLSKTHTSYRKLALVASLFLMIGSFLGWFTNVSTEGKPNQFATVASLDIPSLNAEKILLHINSMDVTRVTAVLDTAEKIITQRRSQQKPLELEIIANAAGIGVLQQGSSYAKRINTISAANQNVSFLACGIAKKIVKLKEGKEILLIPEALDIPAALDRILNRVEHGWVYVRG